MTIEIPQRYSTLWVTLHWVIALLFLAEYTLGFSTRYIPADSWAAVMKWHVPVGISILLLMVVRLVVRHRSSRPEPASAGSELLDKVGVLTHYLLYILAFLLPLAGIALAVSYNLLPIQVNAGAADLLGRFGSLHRWIAIGLALLIGLHIAAAFYHQLIRKDNLLSRMWFEKKA
jgi:cytochrome b561